MNTTELKLDTIRANVREHYGKLTGNDRTCCGDNASAAAPGCGAGVIAEAVGYSAEQMQSVPEGANLGLGCGNPVALASLRPGQIVLDLGSGAGFDAFLAARAVGPEGRVIGVDMTPEMITKARLNKTKGSYANVDFRLGEIEHLPVADGTVDVVLSNCVINLSPDKPQVYAEAFRVLRSGGRLAISDIVALTEVPDSMREDVALYTGCGTGAAFVAEIEIQLRGVGFTDIRVQPRPESRTLIERFFPGRGLENYFASATIEARKP